MMATTVTVLGPYADDAGNTIEFRSADGLAAPPPDDAALAASAGARFRVLFSGRENRLVLTLPMRLADLSVQFDCDGGLVEIGSSAGVPALRANMRVGQDARIVLGHNVSATSRVGFSAVEGVTVSVGDDVMFATGVEVRADDGHPIFDVRTGRRANPARPITVGNHVWVGWGAVLLAGTTIGDGSVVGMHAVVKGRFPNNCIVAGVPARVVRRDIAWERPHLSLAKPYYKPDASTVRRSPYWKLTQDDEPTVTGRGRGTTRRLLRRVLPRPLRTRLARLRRGAR
ncbi:acyltransferase [Kineosporia sp. R_H_3]|uniref:acyltransferase n=1 Tax=Kineosporia sp. R_H_3 TaxID=1961848 RepID=UPI0018E9FF2E|nr:acyltransferase [Kineosporia sp. R_H_3]